MAWGCTRSFDVAPGELPPPIEIESPVERPSVVLIVNDTMRRDRVGAYGGQARTPHFDALAGEGLLFWGATAPAPWTKPSIASLFTGLYPSQHGVATQPEPSGAAVAALEETDLLSGDLETLAERFSSAGYRTAAFVSNPWLERRFGFGQGFDSYEDAFARWGVPGLDVSRAAMDWIRAGGDDPFFLYVHYLDSHRPYGRLQREAAEARYLEIASDSRWLSAAAAGEVAALARFEDGELAVDAGLRPSLRLLEMAYDSGIESFDRALGPVLEALRGQPSWPSTAVVVTSDHGEALYERGYGNHGIGLYDDELAVPLAMRLPGVGRANDRVDGPVSLIDIMPTLCAYAKLDCGSGLAGRSLVAPRFDSTPRYVVSESVRGAPESRTIRNASLKLIWQPRAPQGKREHREYSLFDMKADPLERRDLMAAGRETSSSREAYRVLRRELTTVVPPFDTPATETAPVDEELRDRLRALGYVQ